MTGAMHAAALDRSPRLRRVLEVLRRGGEHSTLDIAREARVCAVSACVAELRANGVAVDCRVTVAPDGARTWLYSLAGERT